MSSLLSMALGAPRQTLAQEVDEAAKVLHRTVGQLAARVGDGGRERARDGRLRLVQGDRARKQPLRRELRPRPDQPADEAVPPVHTARP